MSGGHQAEEVKYSPPFGQSRCKRATLKLFPDQIFSAYARPRLGNRRALHSTARTSPETSHSRRHEAFQEAFQESSGTAVAGTEAHCGLQLPFQYRIVKDVIRASSFQSSPNITSPTLCCRMSAMTTAVVDLMRSKLESPLKKTPEDGRRLA